MKRVFAILALLCVLGVGEYFVVSRFAIRHEILTLFDASRQRPITVEMGTNTIAGTDTGQIVAAANQALEPEM